MDGVTKMTAKAVHKVKSVAFLNFKGASARPTVRDYRSYCDAGSGDRLSRRFCQSRQWHPPHLARGTQRDK